MMKRLFLTILMTIGLLPAVAQITHTAKGDVDLNAEKILKKAAQKMNGDAVSFSVTMVNKDANKKETARQKAEVIYKQGKYKVSFDGNVIYCDGTATWHWNQEANEVVVNKMSEAEDDLMNPAAILANYSKNFRAKYIRQDQNGNAIIDLTPKKSKSYHKIRFIINAESGLIKQMEMHNYDSSCGEYHVSKFAQAKVTAQTFAFPKGEHPDVEIIDMR